MNTFPVTVQITLIDGTPSTVDLQRLSIRELYKYTKHAGAEDTPQIIALCARKPIEWVDTLSDESAAELSQKCFELNFPRAGKLAATDPIAATQLAPLLIKLFSANKTSTETFGAELKKTSPASSPSEPAEETTTPPSTSPSPNSTPS